MSAPPRLQSLLDSLEEKIKQASELAPHDQPLLPSPASSGAFKRPLTPLEADFPPSAASSSLKDLSGSLRSNQGKLPAPRLVLTAASLAGELTAPLEADLSPTAVRIYRVLLQLAIEVARLRGYSPSVSQVTLHLPIDVLACELSLHRTTLWRHLKTLTSRGLVDHRPHKTNLYGQTRNDGSLWAVRLFPTRGKRARLSHEDMKHSWRDLEADVRRGRTAFKHMQQSKRTVKSLEEVLAFLLHWTLSPQNQESALNMTVACSPEAIFDLPFVTKQERGEIVNAVAIGLCRHLGDDSLNFYRRLLWQLLRLHDRGQDYFATVHDAIIRAGVDRREGFARKAGALLVTRLKESGLWDLLQSTPAYRVGVVPLAA